MKAVLKHVTQCLIAGVVALLPVFGTVFTIWYFETEVADPWLAKQPWYLPGMGLLFVAVVIYLLGLTVTTFVGRWLWRTIDRLLDRLPLLGTLYQTLKQLVGYGSGKDAVFREVVLLDTHEADGEELGLVTNRVLNKQGEERLIVFVPGSPNPTTGRLLVVKSSEVRKLDIAVNEVLQSLVSVGATPIPIDRVVEEETEA